MIDNIIQIVVATCRSVIVAARRSSLIVGWLVDRAEWSCVAGLKLRCAGREMCCPSRRQRQSRFSDRAHSVKSDAVWSFPVSTE